MDDPGVVIVPFPQAAVVEPVAEPAEVAALLALWLANVAAEAAPRPDAVEAPPCVEPDPPDPPE